MDVNVSEPRINLDHSINKYVSACYICHLLFVQT